MRRDLAKLLQERRVGHPTRIRQAVVTPDRELLVSAFGWPWWLDHADSSRDHDIELRFGEIGEGMLDLWSFDRNEYEVLEPFSVVEAVTVPWVGSEGSQIYCSAPIPRPMDVYLRVHEFLSVSGSFRRPEHYLNAPGGSVAAFAQIAQSSSFFLAHAPPALARLLREELGAQGVPHNLLAARSAPSGRLLVTMGCSQFFCETALAEFD